MWNMVVDELLGELKKVGVQVQGYADNIVLVCRGKYDDSLWDRIQTRLGIISN